MLLYCFLQFAFSNNARGWSSLSSICITAQCSTGPRSPRKIDFDKQLNLQYQSHFLTWNRCPNNELRCDHSAKSIHQQALAVIKYSLAALSCSSGLSGVGRITIIRHQRGVCLEYKGFVWFKFCWSLNVFFISFIVFVFFLRFNGKLTNQR